MNLTKIVLSVALFGALTSAMADTNIDAQITKIQNAPAQERVQLMNNFKQQLANMNQEDRIQAISQMQEKMHGHAQENMKSGQDMGEAMHQHLQDTKNHAQGMGEGIHQMRENMDQAHRTNQMNQMKHQNNQTQHNNFGNRH